MPPPRFVRRCDSHFRSHFIRRLSSWLVLSTALTVVVTETLPEARGASVYWDTNGSAPGASGGGTATGTWNGANLFWNDAAGLGTGAAWSSGDTAIFAAGANATNIYTVTVAGTQAIGGLTFEEGFVTLTGGTLQMTANATYDTASNLTATINSIIGGPFNLTKTGAGTLVLGGLNTYSGRTIINAGFLSISSDGNLGAVPGAVTADSITFGGSGTLQVTGTSNPAINANRGMTIGNSFTGSVQVVSAANTVTYGGFITGAADTIFKKTGAGAIDLQAASSAMTGTLQVDGGTLRLSGNGAMASTAAVILGNRGTLTLDNGATNVADRTAGAIASNGGTINFIANAAATAETLGAVTLNAGALTINSNGGAGGATLTIPSITRNAGGTLYLAGTGLGGAANRIILSTAPALVNSVLNYAVVSDGTLTSFATYPASGGSNQSVAPLALVAHNQGAETTWVATSNARPTADVTNAASRSLYTLTLDNGIDLLGPIGDRNLTMGGGILQTGGTSIVNTGATTTNGTNFLFGTNEALFHILGSLQLNRGSDNTNLVGTGGFTKTGAGTLILNGVSSLTGAFNVNEGILELRGGTSLMTTAATVNLNGATLRLSNDTSTTYTGNWVITSDAAIQVDRVTAAATATTHTVGGLSIGGGRVLSVSSNDITSGTAYGFNVNSLTLTPGGATLDVASNGAGLGTMTIVSMTGAFPITKTGTGDLMTNSITAGFSGPVDIQAGRVGWSGASGTITETQSFSGAGSIFKTGDGIVNLTGVSTFTGGITVTDGTLRFSTVSDNGGPASSLGQGTDGITLIGGTNLTPTLSFGGAVSQSTNRGITVTGGTSSLDASGTAGATITFTGVINTAGISLNLTGTGAGFVTGAITQSSTAADLNVNSGTWTLTGTNHIFADDIIVTGPTAVLNLNTTGVLTYTAGASNGLYSRTGSVINMNAQEVNGIGNSGGLDFILLGDTGAGTLNTNGFNIINLRLDIGDDDAVGDTGSVTGTGTVTVTTDFNLYRGTITANLAGAAPVEKFGVGDVTLSGDNSGLTSTTAVRVDAGNLILDYTASNTDKLRALTGLDMRGGTLILNGNAAANTAQSVASVTLANGGANSIILNSAAGFSTTLNLGAITRGALANDGTIRFKLPANGSITTTSSNNNATVTGILGGWATVDTGTGLFFARNDGSNNIVAANSTAQDAVGSWVSGDNVTDVAGFSGTLASSFSLNSLRFDANAASTVTVNPKVVFGIASGGILMTANAATGAHSISGGILVSGIGELIFTQESTAQPLTVSSSIMSTSGVTKAGNGTLILSGPNNYSGATDIQAGTLVASGGNAIGDASIVTLADDRASTFQILGNETIGTLAGGNGAPGYSFGTVDIGSNTLTVRGGAIYGGVFVGNGTIIKDSSLNTTNLNLTGSTTTGFTGTVIVNNGLFQLSGSAGRLSGATSFTINKGGAFLIDNNDDSSPNDRLSDSAAFILNSADGTFGGATVVRGLSIRTDNNGTENETIGVLTFGSGANYLSGDASGTTGIAGLLADNFVRSNSATVNARARALGLATGDRDQFRIVTAANQTAFIGTVDNANLVGGGGAAGTKAIDIVPWAIGESTIAALVDTNMGNSLVTYVSGTGFRPLDLVTEYNTFATRAGDTDNIRESRTADLTQIPGTIVNALVLHNNNTAASTISFSGNGAGQTLTVTSGAILFTLNNAATASSAHNIIVDGFDGGITMGGAGITSEYVIHVVNPSSAANTPTLTVSINSPLTAAADITKAGRGTLILTSTNNAGGSSNKTTINEGTLQIGDLANIGGDSGGLVFAGGTLQLGAAFDVGTDDVSTRTITFLPGGGTIDTNGKNPVFAHSLGSGGGTFTKAGAGNLTLNAPTTLTGGTIVSLGTLTLGTNQAIGTGDLTVATASTLDVGVFNTSVANLTVTNAANVLAGSGILTVRGTATVNRGTIAPQLSGAMNLIKLTASQSVVLSNGANDFTGYVQIQDGTLSIATVADAGVASSLGAATLAGGNSEIRLGNGTTTGTLLYTGATGSTDRSFLLTGTTGGGIIDNDGSGALTLTGNVTGIEYGTKVLTLQGAPTTFTNVISGTIGNGLGTVAVTKAEAGRWSLTGTNTYNGNTTITAGTLVFGNLGNLGTGTIVMNGGELEWAPGNTADISTRTVNFTANAIFDTNGNNVTFNNAIGGTAAFGLTKMGNGTLTLAATYAYTGAHVVSAGTLDVTGTVGTIGNVTVANAAGNAVLNIESGGVMNGGTITAGTANGAFGAVNVKGGTLNMITGETTDSISFGAANGGYGAFTMSSGTFTQARFMFGGTSGTTGTGGIGVGLITGGTVNTNGFIILARAGASTGVLTITNGTINHTGASQNINVGYAGSGRAEFNVAGGLVDNTGRTVVFGGGTWTGTGILNLNAGTLLTNGLVHTSGTSIANFNGGTLKAAIASTVFIPTNINSAYVNGAFGTFAGGLVLDTNSFAITLPRALLAPTGQGVMSLSLGSGGSGYVGAPYVQITGDGTGATGYAVVDTDPLSATFGQVTSIVITNPGVNYTSASVTLVGGGGTGAGAGTALGANSSGGLTKVGIGVLTLTGLNTYTGVTTVTAGSLALGIDNALATASSLTVDGGIFDVATFKNTVGAVTLQNGSIVGTTGLLTSTSAYDLRNGSASAVLSGTVGATKSTAGTVTLSGVNTYSGVTAVNGGTLAFSTSANLGDASATNTVAIDGGTLSFTGAGAVSLGATRILTIGANDATIDVGSTTGVLTFGGVSPAGTGDLIKTGAGTVILTGTSNWNAGASTVTVTDGTLRAGFGTNGIRALLVGTTGYMDFTNGAAEVLTLGTGPGALTLTNGARLGFELDGTLNDGIVITGPGTALASGIITLDFFNLGTGVAAGTYNLISSTLGGLAGAQFVLGAAPVGFNYAINKTDTLISLTTVAYVPRYWTGSQGGTSWNTISAGPLTNWSTDAAGTVNAQAVPSAAHTVIFSASSATGPTITTSLDAPFTIDSLQFLAAPAGVTAVTINAGTGGTLTLAPVSTSGGILVGNNAGTATIAAPLTISTGQTWNIDGTGTSSLVISGNVAFNAAVNKTGAGAATLSGNNSGSGAITLSTGTLNINSATALGSGAFNIGAGTTINNSTAAAITLTRNNLQSWNGSFTFTGTQALNLGTGAVTLGNTLTLTVAASTLTVGGTIDDGLGAEGLTKAGAGTLVLNAPNAYDGLTTVSAGTLTLAGNNSDAAGGVTLAGGTLNINNANALGAGTFTITGGTFNNTTAGAITVAGGIAQAWNGDFTFTGTQALNLGTGPVTLGASLSMTTTASTLTVGGVIDDGVEAFGVTKLGTGSLTLTAASTYGGPTIIQTGIVNLGINDALPTATALTVGNGTTAATFNLQGFDQTVGALSATTSSTTVSSIVINSGHTLTVNGNVSLNNNTDGATTLVTMSGGGALVVDGASFTVGNNTTGTNSSSKATLDLAALSSVSITLTGVFAVQLTGDNNSADISRLILSNTANSITATTFSVGASSTAGTQVLVLGAGTNVIHANTVNIGAGGRDGGSFTFGANATGSVTIANTIGTGRATMNIGTGTATTGVAATNLFDVTGHQATLLLGTFTMGGQNRNSSRTDTFSFDQGTLDATTVVVGAISGTANAAATNNTWTDTMNLGGGVVTIGTGGLDIAIGGTAVTGTDIIAGTVNVSGGAVTIANNTTFAAAVRLGQNTIATGLTTNGILNITGGSVTVAGHIIKGVTTGAGSATVTLNGGTLDMTGRNIGAATALVTFNAQQGTLRNLAQLNGGAALTKTTSGTLTVEGTNSYTGATNIDAGTMIVSGSISGATATVAPLATLNVTGTVNAAVLVGGKLTGGSATGATGVINSTVTISGGGVINPGTAVDGANTGILTATTFLANSNATLSLQLNQPTAGSGYDQVRTGNAINLNADGGSGALLTLDVSGYSYNFGDLFFIVVNSGASAVNSVATTFANATSKTYFFGTYDVVTMGGIDFAVSRFGNSATNEFNVAGGNDVVLMTVPEPNALAMLAAGLGLAVGLQRLRRPGRRM